jgi:hypothetical protein
MTDGLDGFGAPRRVRCGAAIKAAPAVELMKIDAILATRTYIDYV